MKQTVTTCRGTLRYACAAAMLASVAATSLGQSQGQATTTVRVSIEGATVTITKYFDSNRNGVKDASEALLPGWSFGLVGYTLVSNPTGVSGTTVLNLQIGSYTLGEIPPAGAALYDGSALLDPGVTYWAPTAGATRPVSVQNTDPISVSFGNMRLGNGNFHSKGFWGNSNGVQMMANNFRPGTNTPYSDTAIRFLTNLNLRNGDGSHFLPKDLRHVQLWLANANANNMAYMLSAQLAAARLSVRYLAGASSGSLIYAPQLAPFAGQLGGALSSNHFITIEAVMLAANADLAINGLTVASGPARNYQTALKTALDHACNNANFVQSGP